MHEDNGVGAIVDTNDTNAAEDRNSPITECSDSSSQSSSPQSVASSESSSSSSSTDLSIASSYYEIFGDEMPCSAPTEQSLPTYKLVGDNYDTNLSPRYMRIDKQTKSLHYFHVYGVKDRIDLSRYSDAAPLCPEETIDFGKILPSKEDESALLHNFSFLIARILKKYMPYFNSFGNGLERHIRHEYSEEMSLKSEVVSAVKLRELPHSGSCA
jgi:hypothetical protein